MMILILGSQGMLGQELVRGFSDCEVVAWDHEQLDITDAQAVQTVVPALKPDIIINAAAYNAVDKAEEDPTIANRVNGDAVGYLVKAAVSCSALYVHYSTDYVFAGTKKEGYKEDDSTNPISKYGASKLLGEQNLLQFQITNNKFQTNSKLQITNSNFYLVRTSRLFGREGGGKKSFVDTMLALAKTKDTLEVVNEEWGSPTYAADLALRTREILDGKQPGGFYHVTNSGACTWYEFAQEIFKQAAALGLIQKIPELIPVPASKFPRPAKRPAFSQLLNTKLPPLRSWQDALREYLMNR